MALIRITAPVLDPVTLEEAKLHIRVDHADDDAAIASMISTATERLDSRDGSLGRRLITQVWKLTLDRFPAEIDLPLPPCQSVTSITYLDAVTGNTITLAPNEYQAFGLNDIEGAFIRPAYSKSWPSTRDTPEAVAINFVAGYGSAPVDIPEPIRAAIKLHVGHLYEHRESVATTDERTFTLPDGYEALLLNHRDWSF